MNDMFDELRKTLRQELSKLDESEVMQQQTIFRISTWLVSVVGVFFVLISLIFSSIIVYAISAYALYKLVTMGVFLDNMNDEVGEYISDTFSDK